MEDKQLQTIRYKLQKRIRRLYSAKWEQFVPYLRQFFAYFNSTPILCSVRDDLIIRGEKYNVKDTIEKILSGRERLYGENEEEAAAMGYEMLQRVLTDKTKSFDGILATFCMRSSGNNLNDYLEYFIEEFLEPFYEYIDEHIDDQHVILYLLRKYKHRCEWFQASRLRQMITEDTKRGEKNAALDIYEYLHNAGVDFNIEPKSVSGIVDFITEQIDENRIIADAKIYWPESNKGKPYLISGFNQLYTYTCDYNEQFGYLIIFNLANEDIRFLLPAKPSFPSYTYNNKTIFFVVIDIFDYDAPASKRGRRQAIDISEDDLVGSK